MDARDLPEVITVAHKTGISKTGDPTYGGQVTMAARVERAGQRQVGQQGDELDDTTTVFTQAKLSRSDMVWFAEDDTSSNDAGHRVVEVSEERDLDGRIDHYEARF